MGGAPLPSAGLMSGCVPCGVGCRSHRAGAAGDCGCGGSSPPPPLGAGRSHPLASQALAAGTSAACCRGICHLQHTPDG